MARADAVERSLAALRFFRDSDQSGRPEATGYKGFYYHFLDLHTGARVWRSELSMIDTALLIAGALTAGMYFTANTARRDRAARTRRCALPPHRLALGAERRRDDQARLETGMRIPALRLGGLQRGASCCTCSRWARRRTRSRTTVYKAWTATYQWENLYGYDFLYAGPLFVHQFSHAWIDFRGIQDRFMREKRCDYFENSRRATLGPARVRAAQSARVRRLRRKLLGPHGLRWPERRVARAGQRAAALVRLCRARRAVRAGRRNPRWLGGAGVAAVRTRDRPARAVRDMSPTLSRDAVRTTVRERLQSDARRRRPARLGFGRPLRARPGHRGDDDREPSHRN